MSTRCLICESSAVLSNEAVGTLAMLASVIGGFMNAARRPSDPEAASPGVEPFHLEQVLRFVTQGIELAQRQWAENQPFLQETRRFQFMQHDCLCLRCGALFNQAPAPELNPDSGVG
ncbi:hypothetical protein [Pseudomonas sediminis]|uniref:hypothetical protein n=1 Tax=Pseudomonas sediminis TaxID=1691904 RepID=UPI00117B9A35|nr:hypothetical protein [Pseudomonas sp. ALS1279]TRO27455.1 hypothetical protein EQ831_23645 [Pseudomonas sp. ALS1279]